MAFLNDLFISYSSKDHEWARKLYDDLTARQFKVFIDEKRLEPGKRWEDQLLQHLEASRNLLVLWSGHARDSQWVTREIGFIEGLNSSAGAAQRRLIFVPLDDYPQAYKSYQMLTELKDAGAYAGGLEHLDGSLWTRLNGKIEEVIRTDNPRKPILQAILTMTDQRLDAIDPGYSPAFAPSLDTAMQSIGINTLQQLKANYGPGRNAWQPFGSPVNVDVILDELLTEVNAKSRGEQFRWEPIADEFWSNDVEAVDRQIGRLAANLCVVVIDPLALYDDQIRDRLDRMEACFTNPKALFMLLAPFKLPDQVEKLRDLAHAMAKRAFDRVYEFPQHMGRVQAYCALHVSDNMDAKRWLQIALGPYLSDTRSHTAEYLSMGGGAQ